MIGRELTDSESQQPMPTYTPRVRSQAEKNYYLFIAAKDGDYDSVVKEIAEGARVVDIYNNGDFSLTAENEHYKNALDASLRSDIHKKIFLELLLTPDVSLFINNLSFHKKLKRIDNFYSGTLKNGALTFADILRDPVAAKALWGRNEEKWAAELEQARQDNLRAHEKFKKQEKRRDQQENPHLYLKLADLQFENSQYQPHISELNTKIANIFHDACFELNKTGIFNYFCNAKANARMILSTLAEVVAHFKNEKVQPEQYEFLHYKSQGSHHALQDILPAIVPSRRWNVCAFFSASKPVDDERDLEMGVSNEHERQSLFNN